VSIEIGRLKKELSFKEAGLGDRRHKDDEQDQLLETLKLFAATHGNLPVNRVNVSKNTKTPRKTRVSRLRRHLQSFFQIEGDPIRYKKGVQSWVCSFQISLAGHESFPTPAGTSWLNFRFHLRGDGDISVSIPKR